MICSVGLTCVDIVSFLPNFPVEDSDQRCTKQTWERGGNASNNSTVLACLGAQVEYFGTLANDNLLQFLQNDFDKLKIKHDNCPIVDCEGNGPISVVVCSEETGSRTIIHSRGNLRELLLEDFQAKIDFSKYSWIHFEGRNEDILPSVLTSIQQFNQQNKKFLENSQIGYPTYKEAAIPISIEIEKHKASLEILLGYAHVIFVGKDFAKLQGANNSKEAVMIISKKLFNLGTLIICPWGDQGASFCVTKPDMKDVDIISQKAYIPETIADSLGAGDTFIATVIHCLNKGMDVSTSVDYGCRIASEKLKIKGLAGIKTIIDEKYPELKK